MLRGYHLGVKGLYPAAPFPDYSIRCHIAFVKTFYKRNMPGKIFNEKCFITAVKYGRTDIS